ncbi:uncharacterized protein LOC132866049 [Neoarius graeffei]|uniref:uncharacterized protein LOC132866049 n=1 Tax=Neoarius graeffei TaxID=443677 RepID=UPI00298C700D|nr:uncharacterized protein LOC132866049 [Neoarius graeffei]
MEQKFGLDREGSSNRRRSSILKAPRPSMKVFGNDQDENQEETRSLEKRRSSRRVSFATTNNIHVFPKDVKADPVLSPIQNVTHGASGGQNEKTHCFDTSGKHKIMGLNTMLTTPIHFALNKENFFPEPTLPVDCGDRTLLLGENTGYMDMTCSQTIAIETEDVFNPEYNLNMYNVGEPHKLKSQNGMPCKTFGTMEKDVMHSEFNDFLSRLSKTSSENVSPLLPNSLENISNAKTDKENVLPTCLNELALPKRGCMDMTTSHTVVIEEAFQRFPYSAGGNCRTKNTESSSNDLDDMELTCSQTATINLKCMENVNRSMSYVQPKKCKFVRTDPIEMMTDVLDVYVQEPLSEQNRADHLQSIASFAPVADSDDMEVTRSQTVVLETKYGGEPFSRSRVLSLVSSITGESNRIMMNTTQTGNITSGALAATETGECKRNTTLATQTVFHNDQSDFMELTCQASTGALSPNLDDSMLTGCGNLAADLKPISTTNVMSKPQASFMLPPSVSPEVKRAHRFKSESSVSHMVVDMEMTQCHTVGGDLEKTCPTVCDDMEMTQCQTVVLEAKSCDGYKSLASTSFGTKGMTHEHTASSKRTKPENCVEPTAQKLLLQDLSDCMEMHQSTASDMSVVHDMELTGCKTITIDTKTALVTHPSIVAPSTQGVSSSRPAVDEMKRSGAILEQLGTVLASQAVECKSSTSLMDLDTGNLVDGHKMAELARHQIAETKTSGALAATETGECKRNTTLATHTVFHNDQSDFMELTCQASTGALSPNLDDSMLTGCGNLAADLKPISTTNVKSKPQASFMLPPSVSPKVKRTHRFKSESSVSHMVVDMEMTQCHTVGGDLEKTCPTVCDDMEMTQCQTVVLETKSCDGYKSLASTSFRTKGMTHEHTASSKRTKPENCVEPTAQKLLLQDLSDCMEMHQSTASDMSVVHDMELTGCKTITIDTKTALVTSPSIVAPKHTRCVVI